MRTLEYTVRLTTPAFLGDAEQNGRWRTPPFKALLRQWWRVAVGETDLRGLRDAEGRLFGAANDEGGGSQKSQVRLRLDSWADGTLRGPWGIDPTVAHPEVGPNGKNVGAHLYLGYGPLEYRHGTALKRNAAIQADESNTLRVSWPDSERSVADAIQLAHWFGTVGSRSRNGWGSLDFRPLPLAGNRGEAAPLAPLTSDHPLLKSAAKPLLECLRRDWAHAVGTDRDGRLLIWQSSRTFPNWREAIQALAGAKIGFRRGLAFTEGETPHQTKPLDIPFNRRHLLAYPVTHHAVAGWAEEFKPGHLKYDRQGWVVQRVRLANQLRFKVALGDDGQLVARIFHFPCALPLELAQALASKAPSVDQQKEIWQSVHGWLDDTTQSGFRRI